MEVPKWRASPGLNVAEKFLLSYIRRLFCWLIVLSIAAWLLSPFQWFRRWFASRLFRFVAERRSAQLLRLLATASDAGRPLAGSMSTLARYHFDRAIRAKLLFARNEIELGAEPWSSLATARLLSIDESTSLAKFDVSLKTRSWLMQQLAKVKEDKVRQRISIVSSFIHPAIIVLLGLLVLWIALACFGSLVDMVDRPVQMSSHISTSTHSNGLYAGGIAGRSNIAGRWSCVRHTRYHSNETSHAGCASLQPCHR